MRILYINSARTFGGGERHLVDLASGMVQRGHQVHVALAPLSPLREHFTNFPAEMLHILRLRNALDIQSALHLARIVRQHRIDIVHAHLARDYPLAAYAAAKSSAQLVLTRHLLLPLNRLHRFALSQVSCVIVVSEAVAEAIRDRNIFPENKIRVIPNGIDVGYFTNKNPWKYQRILKLNNTVLPEGYLVIGAIGELRAHKGYEDLLRVAAIVAKRIDKAIFLIAGEDNSSAKEYRKHLEQLITKLDLEERVCLTGWLSDVRPFLSAIDVVVSSSHHESFGLSIVEAMTCGVPVIASATGGAREVICDGLTGILVPVGDTEKMADAIVNLLVDETQRKRLSAAAYNAVLQHFDLNRMIEATEQVYHQAFEGRLLRR